MRVTPVLAMLMLTMAAFADPVRLALTIEQGQTLAYTLGSEFEIATSIDEQEGRLITTRHEADIRVTVRRLESDGSAALTLMFDRIEIEATADGESLAFKWTRGAEGADDFVPTRESDRPGLVLAKSPVTAEIDAAGRVTRISGLDPFLDEAMSLGGAGVYFVGLFAPERFSTAIESILAPDGSARNALREPGSAWTVTRADTLPPVGSAESRTRWVFEAASQGIATLKGETRVAIRQLDDALATTPRVEVGEQTQSTLVRWDTVAGRLVERTTEQSMTSTWTLGDQRVTQNQSMRMVISRLEPASPDSEPEAP